MFEVRLEKPQPPRFLIWGLLFFVVIPVGIATTLLCWPRNEPTGTVWFWCCIAVFPSLTWCLLFGLRLHAYDERHEEYRVHCALQSKGREEATRFASEPLAILDIGYLTALGSFKGASKILSKTQALKASTVPSRGEAIRHTSIILPGDHETVELRYRSCFMELIGICARSISAIPASAPFSVILQVPLNEAIERARFLDIWRACWNECGFRPAQVELCQTERNLMVLDDWLDHRGGEALEKYLLFVSAQLHKQPPPNSAESGVAILFAWAPLAARQGFDAQVMLHRPVEVSSRDLTEAIGEAVEWGRANGAQIEDIWQTGLLTSDKPALLNAAADLKLGVTSQAGFSGVHDLDVVLGHAGSAAGLLCVALAAEQVRISKRPQLIAWRDHAVQFAIVQAVVDKHQNMEVDA